MIYVIRSSTTATFIAYYCNLSSPSIRNKRKIPTKLEANVVPRKNITPKLQKSTTALKQFCVNKEDGLYSQNINSSNDFMGSTHTSKKHNKLVKIGTEMAEMKGTISTH